MILINKKLIFQEIIKYLFVSFVAINLKDYSTLTEFDIRNQLINNSNNCVLYSYD